MPAGPASYRWVFRSCFQRLVGFTSNKRGSPRTPRSRFSTEISFILGRVCAESVPRWRVIVTFSMVSNGWSRGSGSGSVTSSAAENVALLQGGRRCGRVDNRAPCDVHQSCRRFHLRQRIAVKHALGLLREWNGKHHEVRDLEQL